MQTDIEMLDSIDNTPNAAKLIDSLRHVGYDNYSALADLVDNSIDAEAERIDIVVTKPGGALYVEISDDGHGMSHEVLDQALRLGSMVERDTTTDLGFFGMGLITASLSMCRRLEVLTREADGELLHGLHDVDEVKRANRFVKLIEPATDQQTIAFDAKFGPDRSGTVISLSVMDYVSNSNVTQFANALRKHLSRVHRYFLDLRTITVNGEQCVKDDPLWLDNAETQIFSDETYAVKVVDSDGIEHNGDVRIRLALLPPMTRDLAKERGVNFRNQGLYVLRNQREIAANQTLGLFTRHNELNRFRGEILFSGELDRAMGVNFGKRGVVPTQAIMDKLRDVITPQVNTIKNQMQRSRRATNASGVSHEDAEKVIARKAKLLMKPDAQVEKRGKGTGTGGGEPKGTGKERAAKETVSVENERANVRFSLGHMGREGVIFSSEQRGRVTEIEWNVDHPFYERFVIENKDNDELVSAVDFLVYSMAAAELRYMDEDTGELLANLKSVLSTNLRVLLS